MSRKQIGLFGPQPANTGNHITMPQGESAIQHQYPYPTCFLSETIQESQLAWPTPRSHPHVRYIVFAKVSASNFEILSFNFFSAFTLHTIINALSGDLHINLSDQVLISLGLGLLFISFSLQNENEEGYVFPSCLCSGLRLKGVLAFSPAF